MARVISSEVSAIMDIDSDITDLSPFINVANLLVTEHLSDQNLGDDLLKEIERWLAAHFVTARDPRIKSEKVGDAQVTYQGMMGKGLESSAYGQMVKTLDPTGIMASIDKPAAKVEVIDAITG